MSTQNAESTLILTGTSHTWETEILLNRRLFPYFETYVGGMFCFRHQQLATAILGLMRLKPETSRQKGSRFEQMRREMTWLTQHSECLQKTNLLRWVMTSRFLLLSSRIQKYGSSRTIGSSMGSGPRFSPCTLPKRTWCGWDGKQMPVRIQGCVV